LSDALVITAAVRLASLVLRASADALEAFARSVEVQQDRCPDLIPDFVDDGSAQI
jgi:hypothetical protein